MVLRNLLKVYLAREQPLGRLPLQLAHNPPNIGCQRLAYSRGGRRSEGQDCGNGGGKGRLACLTGGGIGVQQTVGRSERRHLFRDRQVADAELAQHRLHVAAKAIHESVDGAPGCGPVGTKAMEKGKEVQRQDNEPSVDVSGTA
jgi:hypothetical protein